MVFFPALPPLNLSDSYLNSSDELSKLALSPPSETRSYDGCYAENVRCISPIALRSLSSSLSEDQEELNFLNFEPSPKEDFLDPEKEKKHIIFTSSIHSDESSVFAIASTVLPGVSSPSAPFLTKGSDIPTNLPSDSDQGCFSSVDVPFPPVQTLSQPLKRKRTPQPNRKMRKKVASRKIPIKNKKAIDSIKKENKLLKSKVCKISEQNNSELLERFIKENEGLKSEIQRLCQEREIAKKNHLQKMEAYNDLKEENQWLYSEIMRFRQFTHPELDPITKANAWLHIEVERLNQENLKLCQYLILGR